MVNHFAIDVLADSRTVRNYLLGFVSVRETTRGIQGCSVPSSVLTIHLVKTGMEVLMWLSSP